MQRVIIIATALVLVGAMSASAGMKNPCTLLTAADASRVLGSKVSPTRPTGDGDSGEICLYLTSSQSLAVSLKRSTRAAFDRHENEGHRARHITGVGSDAYIDRAGVLLDFWKAGYQVSLLALLGLDGQKRLARLIARRL